MQEIQILRKTKNPDYVGILCPECNENKITAYKYRISALNKAIIKNDEFEIKYNANMLMCDTCKSNIQDIEKIQYNEEQEINNRLDILEIEYKENQRKTEPNKNKYCRIKILTKKEYQGYNRKTDKAIYKNIKNKFYVFKCGDDYPYEYWTLDLVTKEHINKLNCGVCKVLTGSKKKKGFRQSEVNELFKLGITDKTSSSGNYYSEENHIFHYSTIERIRTIYNQIIDNSQCWSAGFAHCCRNIGIASLPLTSINNINGMQLYTIKILQKNSMWRNTVLFTINQKVQDKNTNEIKTHNELKYMLFGNDDNQDFLVELFDKPKTIKQAYESMMPLEAKTKIKTLRQGDLFFIPTSYQFKEYTKQQFKPNINELNYEDYDYIKQQLILEFSDRFNNNNLDTWSIKSIIADMQEKKQEYILDPKFKGISRVYEVIDMQLKNKKGKLKRCKIFDTNHESQFMKIENNKTFVKGQIIHTNRQHRKLVLNQWYQVVKNRVKQSYTVQRFGGMGSD